MAGDVHDGLIARTAFRKIRDERVPVVVPPPRYLGVLADIFPGCFEGCNGSRRITRTGPPKRKDVPFWASFAKLLSVPDCVFPQDRNQRRVQRNGAARPLSCLPYNWITLRKLDLCPVKPTKFRISHTRIERQRECQINVGRTCVGGF